MVLLQLPEWVSGHRHEGYALWFWQGGAEPAASQPPDSHAAAFAQAGMSVPRPPFKDGMDAPTVEGAAVVLTVRVAA
jgi:hypothetical protein